MKGDWPSVFTAWAHLQEVCQKLNCEIAVFEHGDATADLRRLDPIKAIHLAEELDVPDVLPVAFYELSRIFDMLDHKTQLYRSWFAQKLSQLSSRNLAKVMFGRISLRGRIREAVDSCPAREECPSVSICQHGLSRWWEVLKSESFYDTDPFLSLRKSVDKCGDIAEREVCRLCRLHTAEYLRTTRDQIWLKLPEIFDLTAVVSPDWGSPAAK
ncbi:hypothetical protein BV25DRAFT_353122 [Artomyces pyxidatus]|uniref:Uncharacterized protein n=1 Tax=Artomyces pyxidatus TaxID=48021 RepID=A0ACB8SEJ4_9AGAM|nr:hypothetical protein BV25DRAFT_353122 [Artomyces pyxidatus]